VSLYRVHLTEISAPGAVQPWLIVRRVLSVESAPCLAPVLVHLAGRSCRLACGRRLPLDKQCRACLPVVIVTEVRRITA